jgi:hypothetical protein
VAHRIEIWLRKRNARGIATLLEDLAPRTCKAVWEGLPLEGDAYHARYSNNEVEAIVPPLAERPGPENLTIYPIPGDICYFYFPVEQAVRGHIRAMQLRHGGLVSLALFYARNNRLLGPAGYVPGNVFATIVEGLSELAEACESVWRRWRCVVHVRLCLASRTGEQRGGESILCDAPLQAGGDAPGVAGAPAAGSRPRKPRSSV